MIARMSSPHRFTRTLSALAFVASTVACGSSSNTEPSSSSSTTTVATSSSSTTSSTTSTTTTTTILLEPFWPEHLSTTELIEAYEDTAASPLVRVTSSTTTSVLLQDGTTDEGEGVEVMETWQGDHIEGHASFRGEVTITTARASGNAALAAVMLTDGIDYVVDEGILYLPRHVATTLHDDITQSGSDWVAIDIASLDPAEIFVANLLAPFQASRLRPIEEEEETVSDLVFTTLDRAAYETETDVVSQRVELDREGALRSFDVRATFVLGSLPGVQIVKVSWDPSDEPFTAATPTGAEDVTAQFMEYVADRTSALFLDSNG
jgi:hypothetical protein